MACPESSGIDLSLIAKMLLAIKEQNNERAKSMLKTHAHVVDASKTLLHYSVINKNEEITQFLLDEGYDVNKQDSTGTTPLMIAVRKGSQMKIIQILLSAGADIMMLNQENKSALHYACENHELGPKCRRLFLQELPKKISIDKEMAQKLIEAGCHLYQAAYLGNAKVLEYMLEQGFAVDSTHPIYLTAALHVAMAIENVDCAKLLLKYGANVDALDIQGSTPLFYLYKFNMEHTSEKVELLKMLLNQGASLTSTIPSHGFQICPTLVYGNDEIIRLVLEENIDFTAKDDDKGKTVLHYLVANENPGVIEEIELHSHKYNVNAVNNFGMNPLYMAMIYNNVKMVDFLLRHGATPNCVHTSYGFTPLYYAFSEYDPHFAEQNYQCIELMLQHNAHCQFIVTNEYDEITTIFDTAIEKNCLDNIKPAIAHLAIREGLGEPINDLINTQINLHKSLKDYYARCQRLLRKKISGSVTLFKLLTGDLKKMAKYSGNENLVEKLTHLSYKQKVKLLHPYYYNTVKKRFSEGTKLRRFLDEEAGIISDVFKRRVDKRNLIVDKIIDYANNSLQKLNQLQKSRYITAATV